MTPQLATPRLVDQRVRAVLDKRADADAIALRAEPRWDGSALRVDDATVHVEPCTSVLAVRAALAERSGPKLAASGEREVLVVLCTLDEADLGGDVLARLAGARVFGLDPWAAVLDLFGVRKLDAAFDKDDDWLAEALLAHVDESVARPMTAGGLLSVDVAHNALARVLLGADSLSPDAVIAAAAASHPFIALTDSSPEIQAHLLGALASRGGPLGALVAALIGQGYGKEVLALGLAARAVYGDGSIDSGKAAGHFEAITGGLAVAPNVGAVFASRCEEVVWQVLRAQPDDAHAIIATAAVRAGDIGATQHIASDLLPTGFDARLGETGALIVAALDTIEGSTAGDLHALMDELGARVDRVRAHQEATTPVGRLRFEHAEMAARLVAWLATPAVPAGTSFAASARLYVEDGSWVDWARRRLWRGDSGTAMQAVYRRLVDLVVARRSAQNQHFAERLAGWTAATSTKSTLDEHRLVKVEDAIGEVLAPLAKKLPVLFVVLDGCGLASFIELAPQFGDAGFREIVRKLTETGPGARRLSGVATLPTVTNVSRVSLLAGHLDHGDAAREHAAFAANTAIRFNATPAALFHQNKLAGPAGSSLADNVQAALANDGPQVVGVVINTIDDQLRKGDFTARHNLDDLHALVWLLDAARTYGRAVVVSADHGHVLAQPADGGNGIYQGGGAGGERWRHADHAPGDHEVLLRGERVLHGGNDGIVAPWDDDFRYGAKAGGYHGGATPDEVLVPLAVYLPAGIDAPTGWELGTNTPPPWWSLRLSGTKATGIPTVDGKTPKTAGKKSEPAPGQAAMFDLPTTPAPESAPGKAVDADGNSPTAPAWVADLLASDVWKIQKGAAGRVRLPNDRVTATLVALADHGFVASFAALANDTGIAQARLAGFLAQLARVLNVDGYAVLDVDASAQEVRLSVELLSQQFEIETT